MIDFTIRCILTLPSVFSSSPRIWVIHAHFVMHGFYCTDAINFSCQCAAAAGTAAEMPFFSKLFLFHFFYCKAIKKHSSSAFFRSVSLFRASNVRIHQKQKTKKSTKWNNEDKGKNASTWYDQYYCRPSLTHFAQYSRKWDFKNRGNRLSVILWHYVHFPSFLLSFDLFQQIFPLSQLRTIDPQSRNYRKSLVEIFRSFFSQSFALWSIAKYLFMYIY